MKTLKHTFFVYYDRVQILSKLSQFNVRAFRWLQSFTATNHSSSWSAHGRDSGAAAGAAAADKLDDPEGEDEGAILLVGPEIVGGHYLHCSCISCRVDGDILLFKARVVGIRVVLSAKLTLLAEADDSGDDNEGEVDAAEAAATEATDESGGSLVGSHTDDDHVNDEEDHEGSLHGVHDGPLGACLSAVCVALREIREFLLLLFIFTYV